MSVSFGRSNRVLQSGPATASSSMST
jgi:hypothetical protein